MATRPSLPARATWHNHFPCILLLGLYACTMFSAAAFAEPVSESLPAADQAALADENFSSAESQTKRFYLFFGMVNNYPRLEDAEREIDAGINGPFRLIAPGFSDVQTFSDQRDQGKIWNFFIGVGYDLSDRWDVFFQMGHTAGKLHTEATDFSLLLLPLHTDVVLKRSSFFIGPGIAYHPFGMVDRREYDSVWERIKGARPFVATTLHWNYQTFSADVSAGFRPFGNVYHEEEDLEWSVMSAGVTAGADIPVSERDVLAMNIQYEIFFRYGSDFSGPAFNVYWKHYL